MRRIFMVRLLLWATFAVALFIGTLLSGGCARDRALTADEMRACQPIDDRGGLGRMSCADPARDFDR